MAIQNKQTLKEYILADKAANGIKRKRDEFKYTFRFLKNLRKLEYYSNINSPVKLLYRILVRKWSLKTGISIGINTFGKGLYLPHYGSIIVNSNANFGDYCTVQGGVNVSAGVMGGDYIYLSAGAKILKNISIPSYCIVGANAVLTKDINEENVVYAGIPAKLISHNGTRNRIDI